MSLYQNICFRIMEHNIWRQDKDYPEGDPYHAIGHNSFTRIGAIKESLLYILSLVDTIEMTKKFRKYTDNTPSRSLLPAHLGKQFDIEISEKAIAIDYSKLKPYLKKNEYADTDIDTWVKAVHGLAEWVDVKTEKNDQKQRILISA